MLIKPGMNLNLSTRDVFQNAMKYQVGGSTVYGLIIVCLLAVGLYVLWTWCCAESKAENETTDKRLAMTPVFAHEVQPGIIVLQSQDGEMFKILQEFDTNKDKYGSTSCTRPAVAQPWQEMPSMTGSGSAFQFTPTRTHAQYQPVPTAPPPMSAGDDYGAHSMPPPYGGR